MTSEELKKKMIENRNNMHKTKPHGRGIVKALGQSGTTGNFALLEKTKGRAAAIGALQNKLKAQKG